MSIKININKKKKKKKNDGKMHKGNSALAPEILLYNNV
jgi:hypothetical protein